MVLVCRNSTDTAYFQRLRPYPRVMLRRHKCLFKDYDKTPIGFGVVVFCIAKSSCRLDTLRLLLAMPEYAVTYIRLAATVVSKPLAVARHAALKLASPLP